MSAGGCRRRPRARWRRTPGAPSLAALLQQLGHQARPAGLVAGPDASAVVPVEVLVEQEPVAPVGILLELLGAAEDRTATGAVAQEDSGEAPGELGGRLPEIDLVARA